MNLRGRRILIAGSAHPDSTEVSLSYCHTLVSELTDSLAAKGATFIVQFGKDPKSPGRENGPSIIFDWTIAEAIYEALKKGAAESSGDSGWLIETVTTQKTFAQVPVDRQELYSALRSASAVNMEFLEPGWTSAAIRRRRQAQLGDILIAISGGEGVEHLAQEFASRGKHVIPLDINLGASCDDGSGGGARLFGEALAAPNLFFRVAAGQAGAELLDGSRTNRGAIPPKRAAAAIIHLLEQLVAPKVFYVRLLNKDLPEYEAVENFFRNVVDPTITEFGFEAKEMGIGPNEYAWINQAIFDILHHSDVALVDLTGVRPNCLMELGYALGNMQRVIVTAQKGTVLPFDSSCLETHPWNANDSLEKRLQQFKEHWKRNINMPPLVRPRGLK